MLSRPIKTKRNRLLMGSVLITILFFQNCMKGGLEGAGDSALGSGDSSQGGGIGGGGNNPPPLRPRCRPIKLVLWQRLLFRWIALKTTQLY